MRSLDSFHDNLRKLFIRESIKSVVVVLWKIVAREARSAARGIPARSVVYPHNDIETYKGETVKKLLVRLLFVLVGVAGLTIPAKAQKIDPLFVKIPFQFVAGGQTLPAGEYSVSRLRYETPGFLLLSSRENGVFVVLRAQSQDSANDRPKVAFVTVDNQHVLSGLETADYAYTLSVPSAGALLAAAPRKCASASPCAD